MPTYRWTGDGDYWNGRTSEWIEPGETVDLDEHAGEPNDELVRVDEDDEDEAAAATTTADESEDADGVDVADVDEEPGEAADADQDDAAGVEAPLDPSEYSVPELEETLEDGDFSAAELDAIAAAEQAGDDRTTAMRAIDAQRK